jgi:hypothetical protein
METGYDNVNWIYAAQDKVQWHTIKLARQSGGGVAKA